MQLLVGAVTALALSTAPARATSQGPAPVDRTLEMQGITFHVTSPSSPSGNTVTIDPAGLVDSPY